MIPAQPSGLSSAAAGSPADAAAGSPAAAAAAAAAVVAATLWWKKHTVLTVWQTLIDVNPATAAAAAAATDIVRVRLSALCNRCKQHSNMGTAYVNVFARTCRILHSLTLRTGNRLAVAR